MVFVIRVILILIALYSREPWVNWLALQIAVLPEFVQGIRRHSLLIAIRQNLLLLSGSILYTAGFWMFLNSPDVQQHQLGVLLILTGIGGMLGWFPLPYIHPRSEAHRSSEGITTELTLIGNSLLPVIISALFLFRAIQRNPWSESELALLAVISIYSFSLSAIRLSATFSSTERCQLVTLMLLSKANIATVLAGWERIHPDLDWALTSNLPSGQVLFFAILVIDALGLISLVFGLHFKGRLANSAAILGMLSLGGVPPFPGAWWLFALFSVLLLPHQRSVVTHLLEPHDGTIALAVGYAAASLLAMLGHLGLAQTLLEDWFKADKALNSQPARE